ncbi:MAG TPA: 3-dehydroquinate synthase family protein [Gammaproteobacteria bacterium]|nr:3-dehydroquinate synthase family protein [Gammaproteobacteria bacterium]
MMDERILELYGDQLQIESDRIFSAPATEHFKTLDGVTAILDFLHRHQFTKGETLVVVGGGIIQDAGAFVGACYKRGIRWVHFPTTLLSMCDSCIGGKTGINYRNAKNQIALFSAPSEVIINPHFLKTLPDSAIQSGLGEILKLCIMGGKEFLALYHRSVKKGRVIDWPAYKMLILSALSVKRAIVEEDEFELNHRRSLNYGHTLGHVIEALSNYEIPHGIAVVLGMIFANELSHRRGLLSRVEKDELNNLCQDLLDDNTRNILRNMKLETLLDVLRKDKKVESSHVSFVMLKTAGDIQFVKFLLDDALSKEVDTIIKEAVCA